MDREIYGDRKEGKGPVLCFARASDRNGSLDRRRWRTDEGEFAGVREVMISFVNVW